MTEQTGILTTLPTIPFDEVKLPSLGLYYNHTKTLKGVKSIKVPYLTGREQDVLLSPSILESGKFIDRIIDIKLADTGIDPNEMLSGDINAILIFLRSTGIGDIYDTKLDCPLCKFENEKNWKLSDIPAKVDLEKPDKNGFLTFTTPLLKHEVIFAYLSRGEDEQIAAAVEGRIEKFGPGAEGLGTVGTMRMNRQIKSIGGNTDPLFISDYMNAVPYKDKMELRRFMVKNEPGVSLDSEIKCARTSPRKCDFKTDMMLSINPSFFWPDTEL